MVPLNWKSRLKLGEGEPPEHWTPGRGKGAVGVGESFHDYQGEIWLLLLDKDMEESVHNLGFFPSETWIFIVQ